MAKIHIWPLLDGGLILPIISMPKAKIEREDSLTIASLKASVESLTASLEEESEYRTSLEERLESLDDKNDEIISKFIKERDHAMAKYKVIKKGIGRAHV